MKRSDSFVGSKTRFRRPRCEIRIAVSGHRQNLISSSSSKCGKNLRIAPDDFLESARCHWPPAILCGCGQTDADQLCPGTRERPQAPAPGCARSRNNLPGKSSTDDDRV